jgi:hypothetical protein
MNASIRMPQYRCHKKVWALKIQDIEHKPNPDTTGKSGSASYGAIIHPEDASYAPFEVSAEYVMKHKPQPGGYYVVYEDGYKSYSPAEPFESGYTLRRGMDFGEALIALKQGKRVARCGWNGPNMWIAYSSGAIELDAGKFWAGPNRDFAVRRGGSATVLPCITMKTATGEILMGWLASQTDMLAEDWLIVEG